jgi:hypothetical protein
MTTIPALEPGAAFNGTATARVSGSGHKCEVTPLAPSSSTRDSPLRRTSESAVPAASGCPASRSRSGIGPKLDVSITAVRVSSTRYNEANGTSSESTCSTVSPRSASTRSVTSVTTHNIPAMRLSSSYTGLYENVW